MYMGFEATIGLGILSFCHFVILAHYDDECLRPDTFPSYKSIVLEIQILSDWSQDSGGNFQISIQAAITNWALPSTTLFQSI